MLQTRRAALTSLINWLSPTLASEPTWACLRTVPSNGHHRYLSDATTPPSEKGDEGDAPAPPPSGEQTSAATAAQEVGSPVPSSPQEPDAPDYLAMGYTKRQAAWLQPDPEKHKYFLPRLSRKERGSYASEGAAIEFARESEFYPQVPKDKALYNLRDTVPEIVQPRSDLMDMFVAARELNPNATPEQLAAAVGMDLPSPQPPPYEGAERILEWELRLVLSPAIVGEEHPINKKARCKVHLRALQREVGLSEDALRYVAEIAGPRYDERSGVLKLTSEKYANREDNRRHILQMLNDLVEEGKKLDQRGEAAEGSQALQRASSTPHP